MIELSYLGDLTDTDELALQLAATGLSATASQTRARMFAKATGALRVAAESGRQISPAAVFVPGGITLFGRHTAYAGGRAIVAAVEQSFVMVALPRDDRQMIVIDARNGETVRFLIDADIQPQTGAWAAYPMTVARRVAQDFPGASRGATIAFHADLPSGAGLNGSSAMIVGVFLMLSEFNRLAARDEYWHNIGGNLDLAGYLGAVEHGQTFGTFRNAGDMATAVENSPHVAILCSEPNRLNQLACCPEELERTLPAPVGYVLAIGYTGLRSDPTNVAWQRLQANALVELWRQNIGGDAPHLAAALGTTPDAVERLQKLIETADPAVYDRAALATRLEHFILESGQFVPEAGNALAGGDIRAFGRLAERTQRAAEQLLGDQTTETTMLCGTARQLGAAAAAGFGAGFGGSVWALVEADRADDFLMAWADEYYAQFPQHVAAAKFFLTAFGPAAFRVC